MRSQHLSHVGEKENSGRYSSALLLHSWLAVHLQSCQYMCKQTHASSCAAKHKCRQTLCADVVGQHTRMAAESYHEGASDWQWKAWWQGATLIMMPVQDSSDDHTIRLACRPSVKADEGESCTALDSAFLQWRCGIVPASVYCTYFGKIPWAIDALLSPVVTLWMEMPTHICQWIRTFERLTFCNTYQESEGSPRVGVMVESTAHNGIAMQHILLRLCDDEQ